MVCTRVAPLTRTTRVHGSVCRNDSFEQGLKEEWVTLRKEEKKVQKWAVLPFDHFRPAQPCLSEVFTVFHSFDLSRSWPAFLL